MATNNSNSNSNSGDLGASLIEAMLSALLSAPASKPERVKVETDPWAGVQLTLVQTESLQRLGWYQQGWKQTRDNVKSGIPSRFKCGPRQITRQTLLSYPEKDRPELVRNYQFRALICARLAQYGRVSVGDVAIVANVLGVTLYASAVELTNNLKSVLGQRPITRTADGFIVCEISEKQALHDSLIHQWDIIMKEIKGASKITKTAA